MRTHIQIISDAGGYQKLAETLGLSAERVRFWERRKALPTEYWPTLAQKSIATLDELAEAHEAAKAPAVAAARQADAAA